mmetsp:Transcript_53784/g.80272  ORF Transcript_53784/g.80272 Transcript_53784/m.80272 type:complete len:217 (-) Transcript_53784:18-668(-)
MSYATPSSNSNPPAPAAAHEQDVYGYSSTPSSPRLYHEEHLPYDVEEEDGRLWDELNHEQSREYQFHLQQQTRRPSSTTSSSSTTAPSPNLKTAVDLKTTVKHQLQSALNTTATYFTSTATATSPKTKANGWERPYRETAEDVEVMQNLALAEFGLSSSPPSDSFYNSNSHGHSLHSPLLLLDEKEEGEESFILKKTGLWEKNYRHQGKICILGNV